MARWRFSANTGFLWPDLAFLERLDRAAACGFDTVEFHDEGQREARATLLARLRANGLAVAGLNAFMGDTAGRAALPGREHEARDDIEKALELAEAVDAGAVHVLSGRTGGEDESGARTRLVAALRFALERASSARTILIEPISAQAMPGYFLDSLDKAREIVDEIGHPRLKILFDCFHVRHMHEDVGSAFERHAAHVGHVQIASWPERAEPARGELDYAALLPRLRRAGYDGPLGCEYRQQGDDESDRAWRERIG